MSHIRFKCIKGTLNSLTDHISRLKTMDQYDPLSPEEQGQEFGHTVFKPLLLIQVNQIQWTKKNTISKQLDENEMKKLQGTELHYKPIIDYMLDKKFQSHVSFILDSRGIFLNQ